MEDIYLVKAKHSHGSKAWHVGNLIKTTDGLYIITKSEIVVYISDKDIICRFTGLTDKNGKLIWENDIIIVNSEDKYIVAWNENDAMFVLEDVGVVENFGNVDSKWCEVVGNKFDNPELLDFLE